MKEFWRNLKGWQKLCVWLGFLVIIIIIAVSIFLIINAEPKVEITFSEKNNIPGGELKNIRKNLVGVIKNNTKDFDSNTIYKGNARDYKETNLDDFSTAEFIVDFDDIKESYKVSVTWPDPNDGVPNIVISCPLLESKYLETPCATEDNSSTNIVNFLPYSGKLDNGEEYKIVSKYDNGNPYVEIDVNSCGNEAILNKAFEAAKKWVSSIYLDLGDYLVYVPGDVCENDTMMANFPYLQVNHAKTNDEKVNKYLPYFVPGAYNVYPVVNDDNNVVSISAKVPGCYEYQMEPGKEFVNGYLKNHGIDYPVNFQECQK